MSKIIGKYKIELKNVKAIDGHDDTFPYVAELWVNRKHIADCRDWRSPPARFPAWQ